MVFKLTQQKSITPIFQITDGRVMALGVPDVRQNVTAEKNKFFTLYFDTMVTGMLIKLLVYQHQVRLRGTLAD